MWGQTCWPVPLGAGEVSGVSPVPYRQLTLCLVIASTGLEESSAMSLTSVPHQDSRAMRTDPLLRAVTARDAGLGLIRRFNRWLAAGAVATAGLFSLWPRTRSMGTP